jgi:hypothetical protein
MKRLSRLIRDRDGAFGLIYIHRIWAMGNRHHPTTPRSPWQNVYVERLIGIDSAREPRSPGRVRRSAVASCPEELRLLYNQVRTHLSSDKNAADFRRPHNRGLHRINTGPRRTSSSIRLVLGFE